MSYQFLLTKRSRRRNYRIVLAAAAMLSNAACATTPTPSGTTGLVNTSSTEVGENQPPPGNVVSWRDINDLTFANEAAREDFIAVCMAEHGFEYVPNPPAKPAEDDAVGVGIYLPHQPDLEAALAYAKLIGFGLFVIDPESLLASLGELSGRDPEIDPNREIVDSLTPAELTAYSFAMFGSDEIAGDEGCFVQAEEANPPPDIPAELADFTEMLMAKLEGRMAADPRIAASEAEFAACMAAGTDLAISPDDLKDLFRQRTGLDYESVWPHAIGTIDPAVLAELRAEELALAEVFTRCEVSMYETRDSVGREIEQELIEEHPEAVEHFGGSR